MNTEEISSKRKKRPLDYKDDLVDLTEDDRNPDVRIHKDQGKMSKQNVESESGDSIRFLLLDICIDHSGSGPPVMILLGKDARRRLVRIKATGFLNYYYADPSKHSIENLSIEEGVVSVEPCEKAPIYFYRPISDGMRPMLKVKYWYQDKKKRPKDDVGKFETNIKWKRRFQTERNLGAGCTVSCVRMTHIEVDNSKVLEARCHHEDVHRSSEYEISPTVLTTVSIDMLRTHNPSRPITSRCRPEKRDPLSVVVLYEPSNERSTVFCVSETTPHDTAHGSHQILGGRLVLFEYCPTESALVKAFARRLAEVDPDVIVGWDFVSVLESIATDISLSRLDAGLKLQSKLMTNYSAHWVRRPNSRMSSTSNQQTSKVSQGAEGRILLDLLRTTTTKHKLQYYSLAESVEFFLKHDRSIDRTVLDLALEDIDQSTLSGMWRSGDHALLHRVQEHVMARALATNALSRKQALLEETLQAGGTALLLIGEVLYGAQMIRVQSLVLRQMHLTDYICAGSSDRSEQVLSDPINAPFLIDPEDAKTQSIYTFERDGPVAVLDFASLYPSIIIGFNLCYTTYVHQDERKSLFPGEGQLPPPRKTGSATQAVTMAPAYPETLAVERHVFVSEHLKAGLLPSLLRDLLASRARVKEEMEHLKAGRATAFDKSEDIATRLAVLDQRQKQFKLCANAAYGFTGATQASPMPFTPIAESVLRWGQAICRKAITTVNKMFPECKVIYGQTDSLFICLGSGEDTRNLNDAENKARLVADVITSQIGRPPIKIVLEQIYDRLVLCGVNRYAGRIWSKGEVEIVGLESESRKECGLARKGVRALVDFLLLSYKSPMMDCFPFLHQWFASNIPRTLPSDLVITHALWRSGDVVNDATEDESQPHLAVARRLSLRDPDADFVLGERVSFILRNFGEAKKQADKARDPFEDVQVAPDLGLYVKHKLLPPLGRIARIVDKKKWATLESETLKQSSFTLMSVVPKGGRKCLSKRSGNQCRLLVKDNQAICERCEEEGLLPLTRLLWEREASRMELRLYQVTRGRQKSRLMDDALGKSLSILDHAHLCDELHKLHALLETERRWGPSTEDS